MSRKTITTLKCDICGAEFQNTWDLFSVNLPVEGADGHIYTCPFDLCQDCMKDMQIAVMKNFVKITRDEDGESHVEKQPSTVESSSRTELIQFQYKGMSATVECKSDDNENFEPDDPCYIGTLNTGNYDRVYFHGDSLDATWDSFRSCVDSYMSMKETLRNEEMDKG